MLALYHRGVSIFSSLLIVDAIDDQAISLVSVANVFPLP